LAALVAVAVLSAVALTGERVRSLFVVSEDCVSDGVAGLPLPSSPGGDGGTGGQPPAGQGVWSGNGAFALSPFVPFAVRTLVLPNTSSAGVLSLGSAPAVSGPSAAAFQVVGGDCGPILDPGESCSVVF
jgi:hypothetical protein